MILAVDGGNSKTDLALLDGDGRLLAALRGPTTSHQQVGLAAGMERLAGMVADAAAKAGSALTHGRQSASSVWPGPTRPPTLAASTTP